MKLTRVSEHVHSKIRALEGAVIYNERRGTPESFSMVADARRNLYEYIESLEERLLPDDVRDISLRF